MGKINVKRSARMESWVNTLRKLEFPSINFIELSSPIDDGGKEAVNKRRDEIEKKIEMEETEFGKTDG